MYYIGLDIGGTKCAATLGKIERDVEIIEKEKFPTADLSVDEILGRFSAFIEKHLDREIAGIGVSCGGPLDSKKGIIMSPPSLPKWDNIKIVDYFEKKYGIKTYLQNDANACAIAEWKYGAGRGKENVIFLTFGTGFGAGLILNGKLYSGTNDNAGEIGHVRLEKDGPIGYNKPGSCEGFCSGGGIRRLALLELEKEKAKGNVPKFLEEIGGEDNLDAKILADYARKGEEFSKRIYDISAEKFGQTLAILVDLFNPEKIVVGGVFMRSSDLILPIALKVMKEESLSYASEVCEICAAQLGENIGDYAALGVATGDYL